MFRVFTPGLRSVYLSRSIQDVLHLQYKYPTSLVALPYHATIKDIHAYHPFLSMQHLCARVSITYIHDCGDIVLKTECPYYLLGSTLLHFNHKKDIIKHEPVYLMRPEQAPKQLR